MREDFTGRTRVYATIVPAGNGNPEARLVFSRTTDMGNNNIKPAMSLSLSLSLASNAAHSHKLVH